MVLDAVAIGEFQSCSRRFVLSQSWRYLKWRPKSLWDACLRQGILSITQDHVPPADAAADARARFLQSAADPGLDVTNDPFIVAKDWCAMLQTTLRSLAREGLPTTPLNFPPVRLNSQVEWVPMAQSDGQTLHRWISIDHWGEDDLIRELHSWRTLGDIATTRMPMMIHVVEIGQMRKGRRASLWARAWKHPTMPNLGMRFKGKLPNALKGWKPLYLADTHVDPDAWVEQMWKEEAAQGLVHHISVKVPTDAQCALILKDILSEAIRMRELQEENTSWSSLPMSRNACDGLGVTCPFQHVCYGDGVTRIEKLGLYQLRSERTTLVPDVCLSAP
jgi:hypothetical protein